MVRPLNNIQNLAPYSPGLSIAEIQAKYGLNQIIKLASNENPLGASPLAQLAIENASAYAFRYPQSGNPRLTSALANMHKVNQDQIAVGNGSDEIIDIIIRIFCKPGYHNIVCFEPCFSIYPIQAQINHIETKRLPLNSDFSFDLDSMLNLIDFRTKLIFLTTPDNPSGYCPPLMDIQNFASAVAQNYPDALVVIDEAYMDFANQESDFSLLASGLRPENVCFLRTFSKSYGLAGIRLGYAIFPENLANFFWRARLPFSVSIVAEEAGLASLDDSAFREATLSAVTNGRNWLKKGLEELGCKVWPSQANFLLFQLPGNTLSANECHEQLLTRGIIIRALNSYSLPEHLRVSIGNKEENSIFLNALTDILGDCS